MQKAGLRRITFLLLMLSLCSSKVLLAQVAADTTGFTWNPLEVTDPSKEGKLNFTQLIPSSATNINWEFGDDSTFTGNNPIHSYDVTNQYTFNVSLHFKLNAKDSTITHHVIANSADFIDRLDSNTHASYVRILRSAFKFPTNDLTLLGKMRFEWMVNGSVVSDVDYSGANGQYPNIRYTFDTGGPNIVTLRAWNTTDPTKDISYSRIINIQPDFSNKVKFTNLPNVFTPNGDNILDFFEVNTSGISMLVFKVFSRSGALVYQNKASFIKWDGKNDNGKDLPEGVYYYIIEDPDGYYENAKGFVYIFRGK